MNKFQVIKTLGDPIVIREKEFNMYDVYYYGDSNSLQLSFSIETWLLIYIEILYKYKWKIFLNKYEVFQINVDDLVNELSEDYELNKKDPELWYSYIFNDLELSLWRPCKPEDIEEDLWENDYQKWLKFSTVWIWVKWTWSEYEF